MNEWQKCVFNLALTDSVSVRSKVCHMSEYHLYTVLNHYTESNVLAINFKG